MKKNLLSAFLLPLLALVSCCGPKDGTYRLQLFTTNDVHGRYFDSLYVGSGTRQSLYAVSHYVDSVRKADGPENVILVDAGDCLQGDNAAYYFNYIDTLAPHLYARMANQIEKALPRLPEDRTKEMLQYTLNDLKRIANQKQ